MSALPSWIDAHAHWAQAFPEGADEAVLAKQLADLQAQGMAQSIQAGVDEADWKRQLELAGRDPQWFRPVLGLHPWWVKDHSESECSSALAELERVLRVHHARIAGVGELGLDFSKEGKSSETLQVAVFERQLEIASRFSKPLVLHLVHSHGRALEILTRHAQGRPLKGIVHAFSGSIETARQYLALGLKLSVGPGLSEPGRFLSLKRALPQLRPEDWVLESDWAGEKFFRTVQAASGLTGRPVAEIARQTTENLQQTGLLD
jgi:TatD DNase family protein